VSVPERRTRRDVPGAVYVPFDQFRGSTDETAGKLPTARTCETLLSAADD